MVTEEKPTRSRVRELMERTFVPTPSRRSNRSYPTDAHEGMQIHRKKPRKLAATGIIDTLTIALDGELRQDDIDRWTEGLTDQWVKSDHRKGSVNWTLLPSGIRVWRSWVDKKKTIPLTRVQFSLPRLLNHHDDVTGITPKEVVNAIVRVLKTYLPNTLAAARPGISTTSIPPLLRGWWLWRLDLTRDAAAPVDHVRNSFDQACYPRSNQPPDRRSDQSSLTWKRTHVTVQLYDLGARQRHDQKKDYKLMGAKPANDPKQPLHPLRERLRVEVRCRGDKLTQFVGREPLRGGATLGPCLPIRIPDSHSGMPRISLLRLNYLALHRSLVEETSNLTSTISTASMVQPISALPALKNPVSSHRKALIFLLTDTNSKVVCDFRIQVGRMPESSKKKNLKNIISEANKLARTARRHSLARWLYNGDELRAMGMPEIAEESGKKP